MTRRKKQDGQIRLYGVQEASEYLGITRRNLSAKLMRGQVIEPIAQLACGPIWSESQLDEQLILWTDNPPRMMSVEEVERLALTRKLRTLEHRFDQLVEKAMTKGDRKEITAVWEGAAAVRRRQGGRKALAHYSEARRALAEAKVLRLVADLREKDPVFAGIAKELDDAANLRKKIKAIDDARRKRAVVTERVGAHRRK